MRIKKIIKTDRYTKFFQEVFTKLATKRNLPWAQSKGEPSGSEAGRDGMGHKKRNEDEKKRKKPACSKQMKHVPFPCAKDA